MQNITNTLLNSLDDTVQDPDARVIVEWANSRHVDNQSFHSSSDYYSRMTILQHSPVLYWKCDDPTGALITDASTNDNHGTVTGGQITNQVAGIITNDNTALRFGTVSVPNTASYVQVANANSLSANSANFIAEIWIKPRDITTSGTFFYLGTADGTSSIAKLTIANVSSAYRIVGTIADSAGNNYSITSTTTLSNNGVYHIILRYSLSGTTPVMSMDINGLPQPTTISGSFYGVTMTNTIRIITSTVAPAIFRVGAGLTTFYQGDIDEVAIYNSNIFPRDRLDFGGLLHCPASYTRWQAGLASSFTGASRYLHNVAQVFDGKKWATYPWAILGEKDSKGSRFCDGTYFPTPKRSSSSVVGDYQLPLEDELYTFGWISGKLTAGDGTYATPEGIYIHFDTRPVTHIGVYSSTFQGTMATYELFYLNAAGSFIRVGGGTQDLLTDYKKEHTLLPNGNSWNVANVQGVYIKIISTQQASTHAFLQELDIVYKEDISADVVSIDIEKIKENNDTTIPIGSTSANQLNITLQDAEGQKYNLNHPTNSQAPYINEDVKFIIDFSFTSSAGEFIPQGTYYADEFDVDTTSMTATIQARDYSRFLQEAQIDESGIVLADKYAGRAIANLAMLGGVPNKDIQLVDSYERTVIADNPLAFWKLNEPANQTYVAHFSGQDTDWGLIWNPDTNVGFTGMSSSNSTNSANNLLIEFWMKQPTTAYDSPNNATQTVLDYWYSAVAGTAGSDFLRIEYSATAVQVVFFGNHPIGINTSATNDGNWHHWAITYTTSDLSNPGTPLAEIYLDGLLLVADDTVAGIGIHNFGALMIGGAFTSSPYTNSFAPIGPTNKLNGYLAEMRVWNRTAPNPEYIRNDMGHRVYGGEANLRAAWAFDEASGRAGINSVAASNTITFSNTVDRVAQAIFQVQDYGGYGDVTKTGVYGAPTDGYWFDDTGATPAATSIAGPVIRDSDGNAETAFFFTGSNNKVRIPKSSTLDVSSAVAWEFWVKPSTLANGQRIAYHDQAWNTTPGAWMIDIFNHTALGQIRVTKQGSTSFYSTTPLTINEWNHVVINFSTSGTINQIWINGVNDTVTGSLTTSFNVNVYPIYIGEGCAGTSIFGFSMYNGLLSSNRIHAHYLAGINENDRRFSVFYGNSSSVWDMMLEVAMPDLGIFTFDENNQFLYETLDQYFNPNFNGIGVLVGDGRFGVPTIETIFKHSTSQYNLSDSTNIIDGQTKLALVANKVTVNVAPKSNKDLLKYEALWDGTDGDSLENTFLAAPLQAGTTSQFTGVVRQFLLYGPNGYVKIDDEIIGYETWETNGQFKNLTRGMFGTKPAYHGLLASVFEVAVYDIKFSSPALSVQYPFVSAVNFDRRAQIEDFKYTGYGATLIISGTSTDNQTVVLQGDNALTGGKNFMSIAGIAVDGATNNSPKNSQVKITNQLTKLIRKREKKELTIDNKYIDTPGLAIKIRDFVLLRYKNPVPLITLDVIGIPHLQLGDRVTITNFDQLNIINLDFFVMQSIINFDGGIKQTLTLRQVV